MCHPESVEGQARPTVTREEAAVPVENGEVLPGLLARPEGTPQGAVLVINDIFGRSPFYEELAARRAAEGFVAFCPEFFHREGPLAERVIELAVARSSQFDHKRALRELNAALDWLKREHGVERLGTIGFCLGGTYVPDLAAERDDLASVCFYGFPVARPGSATPLSAPA